MRDAITTEAVREMLDGHEDNEAKLARDAAIGALGAILASAANRFAGFGIPYEVTVYGGFALAMYAYRVLRARNLLPAAPK